MSVFQRVDIRLSEPICTCEEQNLAWGIVRDVDGKTGLEISCETCKVKLLVPHSVFRARWVFDRGYPGKKPAPAPEKPKLNLVPSPPPEKP